MNDVSWTDLSAFQRDVVVAVCELAAEDDDVYGLAIKRRLESNYGDVNHGHLYPNLDKLVDAGLVAKSELDRRTNEYAPTELAYRLASERASKLADAANREPIAVDGGD